MKEHVENSNRDFKNKDSKKELIEILVARRMKLDKIFRSEELNMESKIKALLADKRCICESDAFYPKV